MSKKQPTKLLCCLLTFGVHANVLTSSAMLKTMKNTFIP